MPFPSSLVIRFFKVNMAARSTKGTSIISIMIIFVPKIESIPLKKAVPESKKKAPLILIKGACFYLKL